MRAIYDPKTGTVSGKLPSGTIDAQAILHQDFVVREMTGEEEDLLAGKGPVMPRLNRVIINCTDTLGTIVDKSQIAYMVGRLTAVDRMVLLVAIRRATLGDDYNVTIKCPSCKTESHATIDLGELETIPMEDPNVRDYTTELASGLLVSWHVMNGHDEEWLQTQLKKKRDVLTLAMLARVDKIGEDKLNRTHKLNDAINALKRLRMSERNELRSSFKKCEGSLDTKIEYDCPNCGHEFNGELDVGQPSFSSHRRYKHTGK